VTLRIHLITTDPSVFRLLDLLESKVVVTCVIVPGNRQNSSKVDAVKNESHRRGIPISLHAFRQMFEPEIPSADIAVSWMYSQIILNEDLERYKFGIINMHGGKIPEYRGANVLQWAIINSEEFLGVTWHLMAEEVDAGEILAEGVVPILPEATALELRASMLEKGIELFPEAWRNLISGRNRYKPDLSVGKIWPVRRPEDSRIPPSLTERRLKDFIRALCPPWPRAFVEVDGDAVSIAAVASVADVDSISYETADGKILYLQRAVD